MENIHKESNQKKKKKLMQKIKQKLLGTITKYIGIGLGAVLQAFQDPRAPGGAPSSRGPNLLIRFRFDFSSSSDTEMHPKTGPEVINKWIHVKTLFSHKFKQIWVPVLVSKRPNMSQDGLQKQILGTQWES